MQGNAPQDRSGVAKRPTGIVILGGAHGTLALARSLGRQKVPVWLISNDNPLPSWSRYVRRTLHWRGPGDPDAVPFLLEAAKECGLAGFLLVPAGDAEVRLVSQAIGPLSSAYRILLPPWEDLRWLCEKPLLYRRAAELGVDFPPTYHLASVEEAARVEVRFPVVLKPNMGGGHDDFSRAKVARADDRASFAAAFEHAARQIGVENVVVQELIPGGGESQFSYAALWRAGQPVAEFTARRTRQYPIEFGYTSTFVEVVEEPQAIESARRLLGSIRHEGLVEVEFKHDARDGKLRVLDVNPRPWSWFALAAAAGVDLGAMLWKAAEDGELAPPAPARTGVSWMYLVRDMAAAGRLVPAGRLTVGAYLRSFASVRAWATFSPADIMPALIDIPLTAWRVLTRRFFKIY
ncbi:ATP-grasp domain-containing protein [Chelativorans sp.]|uniref:carboxylate--amine ligase n=1 Tax=Chelativorans sp. TaxID=2203393 RepID=UPI002810E212|nr:ATP-grasp domain-containing protein [Chelativorans sp.]